MPAAKSPSTSVRVGLALFAVGLLFTGVTVLPFFFGAHDRPVWLNASCMLAPVGLVVAVTGAVRAARADQRAAWAAFRGRTSGPAGSAGPAGPR